jgi:hypothetical protein
MAEIGGVGSKVSAMPHFHGYRSCPRFVALLRFAASGATAGRMLQLIEKMDEVQPNRTTLTEHGTKSKEYETRGNRCAILTVTPTVTILTRSTNDNEHDNDVPQFAGHRSNRVSPQFTPNLHQWSANREWNSMRGEPSAIVDGGVECGTEGAITSHRLAVAITSK